MMEASPFCELEGRLVSSEVSLMEDELPVGCISELGS